MIIYDREKPENITMTRPASLLSFVVLFEISGHRSSSGLLVHSDRNQALFGYSFHNISGETMKNCLERCLANCICLSFQLCGNAAHVACQLCSSNKHLKPQAMSQTNGCTNFHFGNLDEVNNQQCDRSCIRAINCCKTSNPCLNGGTCLPAASPNSRKRFRCKCPDGYKGESCEIKKCKPNPGYKGKKCDEPIRSCRGYIKGSRVPGKYTVIDLENKPFKVYCDFNSKSSMTWTLVQSYALNKKYLFWRPFALDFPLNENDPLWSEYRLSKSRMESVQHDSTKWRLTCRYDTDGVVYTDYALGKKHGMNVLTFNDAGRCVKMEYINIRGKGCRNCTANWIQYSGVTLHFNSESTHLTKCDFHPTGSRECEDDYFGHYECQNYEHRCTSSNTTTTQTWLGGK